MADHRVTREQVDEAEREMRAAYEVAEAAENRYGKLLERLLDQHVEDYRREAGAASGR